MRGTTCQAITDCFGVRGSPGRGWPRHNQRRHSSSHGQVLEFRDVDLGEASTTEFAQPGAEHGIFLITRDGLPIDELDALDPITVRIVAPAADNATPIFRHLINRNIEARATMVREFDSPAEVIVN